MPFTKLTTTDAFIVTDLDGATAATGTVRRARKILPDGARLLARTATYAWAVHRQEVSGASAGINAEDDAAEEAIAAFVTATTDAVTDGSLSLTPGKGVPAETLAALTGADAYRTRLATESDGTALGDRLLAEGVAASAERAVGGLEGRSVVLEAGTPGAAAVAAALTLRGASVEVLDRAAALTTAADVLCCGSVTGMIDHTVAAALPHRAVVPVGPVPVTARGLAVARRRDVTVLPDFVTTSGPLVAWRADDAPDDELIDRAAATVGDALAAAMEHPEHPTLGGCVIAEEFLATWQTTLPFGRPMA